MGVTTLRPFDAERMARELVARARAAGYSATFLATASEDAVVTVLMAMTIATYDAGRWSPGLDLPTEADLVRVYHLVCEAARQ